MAGTPDATHAAHRHGWSVVDFGVVDDRPIMRQQCACGAERVVPAWDRSWTPPARWRLVGSGPLAGRLMRLAPPADRAMSDAIRIDVWSDIACPWCYIGKRNLEQGIAAVAMDMNVPSVDVAYHSFELDPAAPIEFDGTADEYLASRKGIPADQARQMHDRITAIAAEAGLHYDFAAIKRARTARAHQLVHHARSANLEAEAVERLFAAHFSEGRNLGRVDELVALGAEIGLDPIELREVLTNDEHMDAVRADEQEAAALGVTGVPFYVLDGRYGLSGAQPPRVFEAALRQVAAERAHPRTLDVTGAGTPQ